MNELALFCGAGGGLLGTRLLGWQPVCGVEIDPYCREVILRRQEEGHLESFPIWDDVRSFDGRPWNGIVDVVTAGFPCQPFSAAGKQLGADDPRNMWPETIRIIREIRPRFAFMENVPALITSGYFGRILGDLAESGFDCRWACVSAASVGAPHRRNRVWVLADSGGGEIPDAVCTGPQEREGAETERPHPAASGSDWWATEPAVGRVANRVAHRVDRLRGIGNGQVPAVVVRAWEMLSEGIDSN